MTDMLVALPESFMNLWSLTGWNPPGWRYGADTMGSPFQLFPSLAVWLHLTLLHLSEEWETIITLQVWEKIISHDCKRPEYSLEYGGQLWKFSFYGILGRFQLMGKRLFLPATLLIYGYFLWGDVESNTEQQRKEGKKPETNPRLTEIPGFNTREISWSHFKVKRNTFIRLPFFH